MPKSLLVLILLLVLIATPVIFIAVTTPFSLETVALDRAADARDLIPLVPADAAEVAYVPRAGAAVRAMQNHPALGGALSEGALSSPFLPFLLGRSNVVLWRGESSRGAVARLDPIRAMLLRVWLTTAGDLAVSTRNGATIVSKGSPSAADPSLAAAWMSLAASMKGHVFVIATAESHAAFPPLARPAITAATFEERSIRTVSRAAHRADLPLRDLSKSRFPSSAMIAAAVAECPRALKTVGKMFPFDICRLFESGGVVSIYDIDTRKLIPRIHGVLIVPASAAPPELFDTPLAVEERRTVGGVEVIRKEMPGATIELARRGDEVLIGLDKSSLEKYLGDALLAVPANASNATWVLRLRPDELNRILSELHERKELSLLAPEVEKTVRQLRDSTAMFAGASGVVAVSSTDGAWDVVDGEVVAK